MGGVDNRIKNAAMVAKITKAMSFPGDRPLGPWLKSGFAPRVPSVTSEAALLARES